jgi:hypothetical protein
VVEGAMTDDEALDIVLSIASLWGENAEEAFSRRIQSTDTDETLLEIVDGNRDDLEDAKTLRSLWQAIEHLTRGRTR